MPVSKRLTQTVTGDGNDGVIPAPSVLPRDGDFDSVSEYRDVRPDRVQVVTLSGFDGTDSFKLKVRLADGGYKTSIAFVRGTNATAAAIQSELRTLTGDTALTVSGTTDAGPFTISHTKSAFPRAYPKYEVVEGTGGTTGVVTYDAAAGEGDGTIGALGESHRVSASNTILAPTIGTITVTDAVAEVQDITLGSATGGTYTISFRGRTTTPLAYNANAATVQAALRALDLPPKDSLATVTCSDQSGPTRVRVVFPKALGNVELLTLDTSGLTGGTAHTVAQVTAGALGSASIAYTENGNGDSVIAAAVNDATGVSYGLVVDAATPVVIAGLPPGAYHAVLRTVESGRVSKAASAAFTVA